MMNLDYQPIPCCQHDKLEFSVLRRILLLLSYTKNGQLRTEKVMPLDVATRGSAEWLKFRLEDGNIEEIRYSGPLRQDNNVSSLRG